MYRILADAGIEHKGNEEGPHLHSLRHTACIHSMVKCARQGMDMYCCLPILSVFMGHRKVVDTEQYLRLTQEMYPELVKQDLSVTSSINGVVKRAKLVYDEEYS
jgi:integrase